MWCPHVSCHHLQGLQIGYAGRPWQYEERWCGLPRRSPSGAHDAWGCARQLAEGRIGAFDVARKRNQTELILYNLQIIGEAANNVSKEVCEQHPEIDFSGWAGLWHKLVHDYADIDFDIVWNAICNDLPILESALKPLVDALPKVPELPDNIGTFL